MTIHLTTYANDRPVTPQEDALVYQMGVTQDGIISGGTMSVSGGNKIYIRAGHGIIWGRKFKFDSQTIVSPLSGSGTQKKRLIIRLDLGNKEEPIKFKVISGSASLVQDANVNIVNGAWEIEIATFDVSATSISNLKQTFKLLDRDWLDKKMDTELSKKADIDKAQMWKLVDDRGLAKHLSGGIHVNDVTDSGAYYTFTSNGLPKGTSGYGFLIVVNREDFPCWQLYHDFSTLRTYSRVKTSSSKWSEWEQGAVKTELIKKADIDKAQMYKLTDDNGGLTEVVNGDFNKTYKTGDYFMKGCKNSPPLEGSEQAYFYLSNKNLYQSSSYCWQQAVNAQTSSSWVRTLWGGKPTAWKRSSY